MPFNEPLQNKRTIIIVQFSLFVTVTQMSRGNLTHNYFYHCRNQGLSFIQKKIAMNSSRPKTYVDGRRW